MLHNLIKEAIFPINWFMKSEQIGKVLRMLDFTEKTGREFMDATEIQTTADELQ